MRPDSPFLGIGEMANIAGVSVTFYRRQLLTHPDHPAPFDESSSRKLWLAVEVEDWLSDPTNWRK